MAQPCISYPDIFPKGTIFDKFPFLLPNLVCAVILTFGVLIGILFLEETHEELKLRHDVGLQAGKWILAKVTRNPKRRQPSDKDVHADMDESRSLLEDEMPPGYRTTEGSPRQPSSRAESPSSTVFSRSERRKRAGMQKTFTKQVILNIIGYGILA